jgi:nitroreductase
LNRYLRAVDLMTNTPGAIRKVPQENRFDNPILENIYARRSVRQFTGDSISDEVVEEILRAGTYAPSACNRQPWRFVVIRNREIIRKFGMRAKQLYIKYNKKHSPGSEVWAELEDAEKDIFYGAPLLILIFSSPDGAAPVKDCSMAAENMMLAAGSLGVGSCYVGIGQALFVDHQVLNEIGVPADHKLLATLIFGYPAEKNIPAPARNKEVILKWID